MSHGRNHRRRRLHRGRGAGRRYAGLPARRGRDLAPPSSTAPRCRRWSIRISTAAPTPSPSGPRRVLEAAGLWDRLPFKPGPILDIRVTDGQVGRPASKLFLHFDSRDVATDADPGAPGGAFGWMVEARSLRMAINARLHELPAVSVFAPAAARWSGRRGARAGARRRGGPTVTCRLVVAAEGRGSPLRDAGRHSGDAAALRAERHRLRHRPRAPAPRRGAGAFPARRPVRPIADGAGRGGGERLRHRLDRARRDGARA